MNWLHRSDPALVPRAGSSRYFQRVGTAWVLFLLVFCVGDVWNCSIIACRWKSGCAGRRGCHCPSEIPRRPSGYGDRRPRYSRVAPASPKPSGPLWWWEWVRGSRCTASMLASCSSELAEVRDLGLVECDGERASRWRAADAASGSGCAAPTVLPVGGLRAPLSSPKCRICDWESAMGRWGSR
jgi:hypothetical protein